MAVADILAAADMSGVTAVITGLVILGITFTVGYTAQWHAKKGVKSTKG